MEHSIEYLQSWQDLFDAYEAGAIPIVFGHRATSRFEPVAGSLIRASSFESISALANFVVSLTHNATALAAYVRFKQSTAQATALTAVDSTALCRLFCAIGVQPGPHGHVFSKPCLYDRYGTARFCRAMEPAAYTVIAVLRHVQTHIGEAVGGADGPRRAAGYGMPCDCAIQVR